MKVSVITPSYNQAQFLRDNLNSIKSQTYPNIEHIIVDPGSIDGSRNIAQEYEHITPLFEKDKGQSDGICKGFSASSGDILVWLNSDDYYPSNDVIEKVVEVFNNNPNIDIVYGGVDFVDEDNKFLKKGFVNKNATKLFESFQYQVGIVQPGVFWRKDVFKKFGGPLQQYEYCMDYELWVRFTENNLKWKYLDKTLAHHRWWDGMKTSSQRGTSLFEHFKVCMHYFEYVHWKWLDRYADYIAFGADGVVNAAKNIDESTKKIALKKTIEKVINQNALKFIADNANSNPECKSTLDFINTHYPDLERFIFDACEIEILSRTSDDELAEQRPAWNIFDCVDKNGNKYKGYDVPDNFYRLVSDEWYKSQMDRSKKEFKRQESLASEICIVVGNGPSLRNIDFSLFSGHDVIISNFATINDDLCSHAKYVTMVNDLVADQGSLDFNFCETTKIVPFWLANSINPSDNTFFVSSTVVPKIRNDFVLNSSWRSTVTFFNIQLAYTLGYKKVVLVGVDNSYVQPLNAKEGDLIRQVEDDENHFDPNYFKGKDWQAADTVNMEKMYKVAAEHFLENGREIINCTVGGELEVFRRGALVSELALPSQVSQKIVSSKVLILDTTPVGHPSATGQLKKVFFENWAHDNFLQIWSEKKSGQTKFYTHRLGLDSRVRIPLGTDYISSVYEFSPDVIYIRPVDDLEFLERCWNIIKRLNVPIVLHMMDDWPTRVKNDNRGLRIIHLLEKMIARANRTLSICSDMSDCYEALYGKKWNFYRNAVNLNQKMLNAKPTIQENKLFILRYLGGAAKDMNYQSIVDISVAIDELNMEGKQISFEIYTMPWYKSMLEEGVVKSETVKIMDLVEYCEYENTLNTADALIIAYNFDEKTLNYTSLSFANKSPECLKTGKPILVYGNAQIATVKYFKSKGSCFVVDEKSKERLKQTIVNITQLSDNELNKNKTWCNQLLKNDFDLKKTRSGFEGEMISAKYSKKPWLKLASIPHSIKSFSNVENLSNITVSSGFRMLDNNSIIYRSKRFDKHHSLDLFIPNNILNIERVLLCNIGLILKNATGKITLNRHMSDERVEEVFGDDLALNVAFYKVQIKLLCYPGTLGFNISVDMTSRVSDVEEDIILEILTIRVVEEFSSLSARFALRVTDQIVQLNKLAFNGDKLGALLGFVKLYEIRKWKVVKQTIITLFNDLGNDVELNSTSDIEMHINKFIK